MCQLSCFPEIPLLKGRPERAKSSKIISGLLESDRDSTLEARQVLQCETRLSPKFPSPNDGQDGGAFGFPLVAVAGGEADGAMIAAHYANSWAGANARVRSSRHAQGTF